MDAFVFLWAGVPQLQPLVAIRPNMSEAGGLVGLHFMWVHTAPSIRRTAAPRGHRVERAAWPPLLLTHQTFVPVINTPIRNACKYCRSKQKKYKTNISPNSLFLIPYEVTDLCYLHIKCYFRPTSSVLPNLVTGLYSLILVNQPLIVMFGVEKTSIPMSYKTNST